jgi:integrase
LIFGSNLPDRQKADLRSAVQTVARVLGAPAAEIAADPASLRRRLETISPEAHGLSRGRWMNVRSLLGKALALMRPMLPGRSVHPLLPEWAALAATLPRGRRDQMLALLRYLSTQGIGPGEVTLANLEAYRQAIQNDRLRRKPEQTWDSLVWSWNACRREIAGWPAIEITRESRRETYILPRSAFPDCFTQDINRYLLRQSGKDLSEDGPPRPLRQTSLATREYQLRVAASALVHMGHQPADITSLAVLLVFENYQKILRFLLDRHDGKTSPQVAHMAAFLKSVVRHWLKVDVLELERYRKIASRLAIPRIGMTVKNRERLRPLNEPEAVDRFLDLPSRIRAEVERSRLPAKRRALLAQSAAAIAIELVAPIRLNNLVKLDVKTNLISHGKRLYLIVPEHEVKNGEAIDFELPPETVEIVAWYVREYRPLLLKAPTDALFPGDSGKAKSAGTLAPQISNTVFRYTGIKFNVHLFRHAGGKLFLDARPGQYEVVRRVLGHKSMATTTSIYTGAETRSAGQHFARVIQERRLLSANKEPVRARSRR